MDNQIKRKSLEINDCWNHIGVWGKETPRCEKLDNVIHCRNCEIFSQSGQQILEQPLSEEYLSDWATIYSNEKKQRRAGSKSSLVFRLGDEWYSFPNDAIVEVTEIKAIHSIPHSKSQALRGLVNIRGELKICFSIGHLIGIHKGKKLIEQTSKYKSYERMVVISHEDQQFVFPVSEVLGSTRYNDDDITAPPATIANAKATFTTGMLKVKNNNVACLDLGLIFNSIKRSLK